MLPFPPLIPEVDLKIKPPPRSKAACATINPNKLSSKTLVFGRTSSSVLLRSSRLAQKAAVGFFNPQQTERLPPGTGVAISLGAVSTV